MAKTASRLERSAPQRRFQRDIVLERRLGNLVSRATEGKLSLQELYGKVEDLRHRLVPKTYSYWDDPTSNLLLRDALDELHLLHDNFTGEHYANNPQKLREYADWLLGGRERVFRIRYHNQDYEIKYLPYALSRNCKKVEVRKK